MTPSEDIEQTTEHTPEPWFQGSLADNETQLWIRTLHYPITCIRLGKAPDTDRANARRIVATINACQGIPTETLEQGAIAQLRYALGEVLSAATDLDAAIDGVTDQFDAERARLDAAYRAAQSTLDAGTAIDIHALLALRKQIALVWTVEDVQELRPDLNEEQAWKVLRQVERHQDAEVGVTWYTLQGHAENLFGPAPETAAEED